MKLKAQWAGKLKGTNTRLFLLFLLLIVAVVGCNKRSTNSDCVDSFGNDTCRDYPIIFDQNAAWSPDGSTIAYSHGGLTELGDTSGLYLIDTSGNNRRVLVPSISAVQPTFSPDGQWIAFANLSDDAIYKIKINGDSLTRLTAGYEDQEPAWSPDGRWIAYSRKGNSGGGLRIVASDGSQDSPFSLAISSPSWSKDEARILGSWATYEQGIFRIYIGIFNTVDSTIKKLREVPFGWSYLRWSPDNSKILATVYDLNNALYVNPTFLYSLDTMGQNVQKLLSTPSWEGAWSPDGNRIVFTDTRPQYGTLFIMDATGANKKQLTFRVR